MVPSRAATGRAGDKRKRLGLERPHAEETRLIHSQEGERVKPTGEAQDRQTSALMEAHKNSTAGEEPNHLAGSEAHCSK